MSLIPASHKFALISLNDVSTGQLHSVLRCPSGICAFNQLPITIPDHWVRWLGTLRCESLTEANLVLLKTAASNSPTVLDGENKSLEKALSYFFYALLMSGVPSFDDGMILSGANVDGDVRVRSVVQLDGYLRPAHVPPLRVCPADLLRADDVAAGLHTISTSAGFSRLRRGFLAWRRGVMEYRAQDRLHQFIRSLEALVMPDIGATKRQFVHRAQLFAMSKNLPTILEQLFDIRSGAEHLHDWDHGLDTTPPSDREFLGSLRAYQAEVLAGSTYSRLLTDQTLLAHFREDTLIQQFWKLAQHESRALWPSPIDLDLAEGRFRFNPEA